jgi:bacterioferritin-associated ferredoxin
MYVCICKAVTEREIQSCLHDGADSFERLQDRLGVGTCCGRCKCDVQRMMSEHCNGCGECRITVS